MIFKNIIETGPGMILQSQWISAEPLLELKPERSVIPGESYTLAFTFISVTVAELEPRKYVN